MNPGFSAFLWTHRILIAGVALIGAVTGAVIARLSEPVYEATVVLKVVEPKFSDGRTPQLVAAAYLPLVQSLGLGRSLVTEFHLDAPPAGMKADDLLRTGLVADVLNPTSLLRLRARLPGAQLAADVANRAAALAVDEAGRLNREEAVKARDEIGRHLTDARTHLDESFAAVETYRRTAQIELLRNDVQAALEERKQITALTVQIATERARLERTGTEMKARQRTETLKRSIDSDPALMEAARSAAPPSTSPLSLTLSDQRVNPVYESLDGELARTRTMLDSLEQRRAELVGRLKLDAPQWNRLSKLYEAETRLARLELELDVARKSYQEIALRHEQARIEVASRSAQLVLLTPAAVPDTPRGRGTTRMFATGLVLGALLGLALAGAIAAVGDRRSAVGEDRFAESRKPITDSR